MRILFLLALPFLAFAQERIAEDQSLGELKGIVLLPSWDEARREPKEVEGVFCSGIDLLNQYPYFLADLATDYIEKPFSQKTIAEIKQRIVNFYESKNQPFAVVGIPRQELTQGVLQVVVEEARLGQVRVVGNRYKAGSDLAEMIRTEPGQTILTKSILEDLGWINQNPFRRVDAIFTPGQIPGTTDLELVTIDRWPYRFYTGTDNTGTVPTERNRIFFGVNFGNTILEDSQLSYQFTCAPNWNRFFAHTGMYRIPLPWRHTAIFYGGYSEVKPEIPDSFTEKGKGWQVDGRYRIPIMENAWLLQAVSFGYDFKQVKNRILEPDGTQDFKGIADINQFMLGYELGTKDKSLKLSFVLEAFVNPGGISYNNKSSSYQGFRYDAHPRYIYLKMANSVAYEYKKWAFSYDLTGQWSSQNLLPSEQFTLAGYNAVRGFEERIVNTDNGVILNLEVQSPRWSPAKTFAKARNRDEFYVFAFFDGGLGANHNTQPGEKTLKYLGSIGPGLRYQYSRYISARFDYGFQLFHSGFFNSTDSRYNFAFILSY